MFEEALTGGDGVHDDGPAGPDLVGALDADGHLTAGIRRCVPFTNEQASAAPPAEATDAPTNGSGPSAASDDGEIHLLVGMLTELVGLDLARVLAPLSIHGQDPDALVAVAAAWSRVASWATAMRGEALAEIVSASEGWSGTWSDGYRALATEVAMYESISRQSATAAIRTAVMLDGPLQATGDALRDGTIDAGKASLIARTLADLPLEVAEVVESDILPEAGSRTPSQLGRVLNKTMISADPESAEHRARAALDRRRVCHPKPLPDGMASIYAVLPAADAITLDLALDAAARSARADGDARTTDQLRADVLAAVGADALRSGTIGSRSAPTTCNPRPPEPLPPEPPEWLCDAAEVRDPGEEHVRPSDLRGDRPGEWRDHPPEPPDWLCELPEPDWSSSPPGPDWSSSPPGPVSRPDDGYVLAQRGGVPARINVTVPLSTLLGGDEAGEIDGYGAIDAVTARALAMGGTWRRLVTDPRSGTVLDVGRTRYRPPADLAELVRQRDRTCFRPGCSAAATGCELDHTTPWSHLGRTAWANLGPGCSTDHRLKSDGDFVVRQHEAGVFTWTSSLTGISYRREIDGRTTVLGRTHPRRRRPPRTIRDDD